ncbi:MAG: hypothetical protein AAGE65_10010 [Planctomycetota bacterium]
MSPAAEFSPSTTRPRPPWLRALGRHEPPETLRIAGETYRCAARFKVDAFAATAVYVPRPGSAIDPLADADAVVVKFGRTASAFGLPMAWIGAHLCGKERDMHRRLAGIAAVPAAVDRLESPGRAFRHTLVRRYVPGRTLREVPAEELPDDFFAKLDVLLDQVHARGVAVMDLNKAENVLVDATGRPHLIDFQLSVRRGVPADRRWWAWVPGSAWWLGVLQGCDRFYIAKHFAHAQPQAFAQTHGDLDELRPRLTRVWRRFTLPLRALRRQLLVGLKVRRGRGTADTEFS